jgi:hypothetical protein
MNCWGIRIYFTKSRFSLNGGLFVYMELLLGYEKTITKSGISLNAGTLNWGFTVFVACFMNLCPRLANACVWSRSSLIHHRIHLLCQNAANEWLNGGSGSIKYFADKRCICSQNQGPIQQSCRPTGWQDSLHCSAQCKK